MYASVVNFACAVPGHRGRLDTKRNRIMVDTAIWDSYWLCNFCNQGIKTRNEQIATRLKSLLVSAFWCMTTQPPVTPLLAAKPLVFLHYVMHDCSTSAGRSYTVSCLSSFLLVSPPLTGIWHCLAPSLSFLAAGLYSARLVYLPRLLCTVCVCGGCMPALAVTALVYLYSIMLYSYVTSEMGDIILHLLA